MTNWFKKLWSNFEHFAYNEDRAAASLGGAPPQDTISSEAGKHSATNPVAEEACDMLDAIQPDHCEQAVIHAERLDAVDTGIEK